MPDDWRRSSSAHLQEQGKYPRLFQLPRNQNHELYYEVMRKSDRDKYE